MNAYLIAGIAAVLMIAAKALVFRWLMAKADAAAAAKARAETGPANPPSTRH